LDLALFRSRYRDLIVDKKPMGGRGIPGDPALFQTVNIDRALIEGVEVRGTWTLGRIGHGLWDLPFSYGLSRGRDERTRLPLNSILPAKLSATLRYQTPTFDLALATRYTDGKAVSDLESPYLSKPATPPRVAQFTMDSAFVCDFFTEWRVRPDVRIQAALTNLGNRAYWNWSDVQGLAANAPSVAAYTQPGRQARLSLSWMF
jgi:hemoglobin/transferrin/lactoferrin receptor protein